MSKEKPKEKPKDPYAVYESLIKPPQKKEAEKPKG